MPKFSKRSLDSLATVDLRLRSILEEAIQYMDFIVLEGHRDKAAQDAAVATGKSKTPWPTSKHNSLPSKAVDIAPFPLNWNDPQGFAYLAGFIRGLAAARGLRLRWGGDFNRNNDLHDQSFTDLPHLEIDE